MCKVLSIGREVEVWKYFIDLIIATSIKIQTLRAYQ